MNRLFYLGKYAYRNYNFIDGDTPLKPAQMNPNEAMLMLRACLLQTSAAKFINAKLDPQQVVDKEECVEEVMQREFDEPWEEAERILRPLNIGAMLALPKRNWCLAQVFESFCRESVMARAIKGDPDVGNHIWNALKRESYFFTMINLEDPEDVEQGVEWSSLFMKLHNWKEGTLKGWAVHSHGYKLPIVQVYFLLKDK